MTPNETYLFEHSVHAVKVEHWVLLADGVDVVEVGQALHHVAGHVHHAAALRALRASSRHDVRLSQQGAE